MKHLKKLKDFASLFSILMVLCVISTSCSDDEYYIEEENVQKETFHVSPQEAGALAAQLAAQMNLPTRGALASAPKVKDVEIFDVHHYQTRASLSDSISIDTLLYFVNFENEAGFAIVSADKRTEPIFAIADEGNYSLEQLDTEENDDFLNFIDDAIEMELEDIASYSADTLKTRATTNGWSIKTIYHPILKTKWAQGAPYNLHCPTKKGEHCLTGCVITAMAQILAYYQQPNKVQWTNNAESGSATLHWQQILEDCAKLNGKLFAKYEQSCEEVAQLMRFLGETFQADYGLSSTGANSGKAISWINGYTALSATELKGYSESAIIKHLATGNPVFGRGYRKKKKFLGITTSYKHGHAWVYDGYCKATKDGKERTLIHCNWGWNGTANGYYLSKVFKTSKGPEFQDEIEANENPTDTKDYKYKLQYSLISSK